jgi:hypothetical protein
VFALLGIETAIDGCFAGFAPHSYMTYTLNPVAPCLLAPGFGPCAWPWPCPPGHCYLAPAISTPKITNQAGEVLFKPPTGRVFLGARARVKDQGPGGQGQGPAAWGRQGPGKGEKGPGPSTKAARMSQGEPTRSQEPGGARRTQQGPGRNRRSQKEPGGARRTWPAPGASGKG